MAATEQTQGKQGRFFRILTFIVATIALIIAIIVYFRVYDNTAFNQTSIADGAVSIEKLDSSLASQLESAIAYYEAADESTTTGRDGIDGEDGTDGSDGTSSVGVDGADGSDGTTGATGSSGASGSTGSTGATGETGFSGVGIQGPQGATGATGATGPQGSKGDKGDTGDSGVLSTVLGNGLAGSTESQTLQLSLVARSDGGIELSSTGLTLTRSCANQQTLKYVDSGWVCANDQVGEVTTANLVSGTPGVTVTGGTGALIGSGASISIATATGSQNGLLSSADWNTFNNKSGALTFNGNGLFARSGDTISATTCTSSQILVFNGTAWECSANNDTDTTYSAGSGLALDGTVFSLNPASLTGVSSMDNDDRFIVSTADGPRTVSYNDLFSGLLGALNYRGTWDANNNQPDLTSVCATSTKGYYFVVNNAGDYELDGIDSWNEGDWVVCNGDVYEKIETTNLVSSVHGRTGAVTAESGDYTASQITNTPQGNISATTVQDAINELENEKLGQALTSGQIWIGGNTNLAQAVTVTGDATLSNSGILTISNGAITGDKIADGVISAQKIAYGAITADSIANSSISFDKLASTDCTTGQILRYNGTSWACDNEQQIAQTTQTGAGSPQGVVTANIGTIYTDNITGTVYIKKSGNDTSSGWEELGGRDSGLIAITTEGEWTVREYVDKITYTAGANYSRAIAANGGSAWDTGVAYPTGINIGNADEVSSIATATPWGVSASFNSSSATSTSRVMIMFRNTSTAATSTGHWKLTLTRWK